MEHIISLRHALVLALRPLWRSRGFSLSVIVTLALGIGANVVVFAVLDQIFWSVPRGITGGAQVRRLYVRTVGERTGIAQVFAVISPVSFKRLGEALPSGYALAGYRGAERLPLGQQADSPLGEITLVVGDYFGVLGVEPVAGRFFDSAEFREEGLTPSAVVAAHLAVERYGSERAAIGKPLDIATHRYQIVGVAPESFRGADLNATDVWLPMNTYGSWTTRAPLWYEQGQSQFVRVLIRSQRQSDWPRVFTLASEILRQTIRGRYKSVEAQAGRLSEVFQPGFNASERVLVARLPAITLCILVLACANVANLLLTRTISRQREIGIRLALGISRPRLWTHLLGEGVLLALASAAASVIVAGWLSAVLRREVFPFVQWGSTTIHGRTIGIAGALAIVVGIAAALGPATLAAHWDVAAALRSSALGGRRRMTHLRHALLVSQIAISCMLLAVGVAVTLSWVRLSDQDIGFHTQDVVLAGIDYSVDAARPMPEREALLTDAAQRISQQPGVDRVALSAVAPMLGFLMDSIRLPNGDMVSSIDGRGPVISEVSVGYFDAAGIHLRSGREFASTDVQGNEPVIVVNSTLASRLWPGRSAIGECLVIGAHGMPCRRVVGVAADARVMNLVEAPIMQLYLPLSQLDGEGRVASPQALIIRAAPHTAARVARMVEQMLGASAAAGERPWARTFADHLGPQMHAWTLRISLFAAAGVLALAITAVGVYGSISFALRTRARELAIRIAIGARPRHVAALVLGTTVWLSLAGIGAATLGLAFAKPLIAPLLFQTSATDWLAIAIAALTIVIASCAASVRPIRRAQAIDPAAVLRSE